MTFSGRSFAGHGRLLVGIGAVVGLAVVGGLIAFLVVGKGSADVTLPTTGNYRPITVAKPQTGFKAHFEEGIDPDTMVKQGADVTAVISRTSTAHHYKVTIVNTSGIGFINSLDWYPPPGMTIERVLGSSKGSCQLTGTGGFGGKQFTGVQLYPRIACSGMSLKPPSCTCRGDGGQITISFVADSDPGLAGSVNILTATPVLKIIPSYVTPLDEPKCKAGQTSTAAQPCASD